MANKEYNNELGDVTWFSKYELAEIQLLKAIKLFLDDKDYICAITLAGAAEELLGKILHKVEMKNSLDEYLERCRLAFRGKGEWDEYRKWFIQDRNYHRDNLKHLEVRFPNGNPDSDDSVFGDIPIYHLAAQMKIEDALDNYNKLSIGNIRDSIIDRYYASTE